MKKKRQISLLGKKSLGLLTLERLVYWLTTMGRGVLVIVEFVVLLAFFSRFWLDARNNDLGELVRQRRAVLATMAGFENDFNQLRARANKAEKYLYGEKNLVYPLALLSRSLPPGLVVQNMSTDWQLPSPRAYLVVKVSSPESLAFFLQRLSRVKEITKVKVSRAEKKSLETGTSVNLIISFNRLMNKK